MAATGPRPSGTRLTSREVGLTAAAAMVGHSAMDGVAIGAAFQVGGGMGVAVALAVIAHDFADGFNTYTITSLYGNARRRAQLMLLADALAPVVGTPPLERRAFLRVVTDLMRLTALQLMLLERPDLVPAAVAGAWPEDAAGHRTPVGRMARTDSARVLAALDRQEMLVVSTR